MNDFRRDFREVERQTYWSLPRIALLSLITLILLYGIGFVATGGDLAIYKFFAPKQANAEREVFENTQSYVEGKEDYLSHLCLDEAEATGVEKKALAGEIVDSARTIDNSKLPTSLQNCITDARMARHDY